MFQDFHPVADRSFASRHLPLLREQLAQLGLDGFIIPHDDEYQNEYIPAYAERLLWVSGFSGSAGAAIVMKDRAVLFVDGRYTVQARQQTDDAYFSFENIPETSLSKWLQENASGGAKIGYDPMLHTVDGVKALKSAAEKAGFTLMQTQQNPVDLAWRDQPAAPDAPLRQHPIKFAGVSSEEKRRNIAEQLRDVPADALLLSSPTSVAWLFNVRGGDVARTPLPLARAILRANGKATIYIDPEKVGDEVRAHLGEGVRCAHLDELAEALQLLGEAGEAVAIDPALTPSALAEIISSAGGSAIPLKDPCALPRAAKNAVEQEGARRAHLRDGVAVTRFLHWLAVDAQSGEIDEISAAEKLEALRAEDPLLADLSFDSISAACANAAICHYRVTTSTNEKLRRGTLYLIDSGAQYPDGTTDVTRTVPIGDPTAEMRDRFTRVLKGHIAIATARFPVGASGAQLDALARMPLWSLGLDFDHGTGHGVGSFLGVHEGPQGISKLATTPLRPGMIVSNEPGYYKEGAFGIRIENLVIVRDPAPIEGGERDMLGFETITLAPICRDLIDVRLLTESECSWLNAYHESVFEKLSDLLPADTRDWLAVQTAPI